MMSSCKMENGIQLLRRLTKRQEISGFYPKLFKNGPDSADMIQITGNQNSGKSYLLADIISEAILGRKNNSIGSEVLVINTDGNTSVNVIETIIKYKTNQILQYSKIENCLKNLYFIDVYDATQLYVTLNCLDTYLMEHPNISLIIIDTLTAYYWSEQNIKLTKMSIYLKKIIKLLSKTSREHKVPILNVIPDYFHVDPNEEFEMFNLKIRINMNTNYQTYEAIVNDNKSKFSNSFYINDTGVVWI